LNKHLEDIGDVDVLNWYTTESNVKKIENLCNKYELGNEIAKAKIFDLLL
jgi:hypothetical protein